MSCTTAEGETLDDVLSWDGDKFSSWHPPIMLAALSKETVAQGLAPMIGKTRSNRDVCDD